MSTDPSRSPRTSGKAKTPRGHGTRGPKPGSPKARNGGLALKAKKMRDDPDYYKRISKMGGQAIRDGYGRAYYEVVGARGGLTTHAKHPEHLRRIGPANAAKGAAARWKGHVKARKDE